MAAGTAILADNLRLAGRRLAAAAGQRPRLAYIGGEGTGNLGDEAMFDAMARIVPGCQVVSLSYPRHERRLARVRLAGQTYFAGMIVGGGTLINEHFLGRVETGQAQGLRAWSIGTGVGSTGFGMGHVAELEGWKPALDRFERVTVRGPRSAAALAEVGVEAEVIGDLALALGPAAPIAPTRAVAVNVSRPEGDLPDEIDYDGVLRAIRTLVADLAADGWRIVPVALHHTDLASLRWVTADAQPAPEVRLARTADEFFDLVGPARFAISVRLHGAVLAACAGVPPLMLSYRDKCHDFMESLGLGEWAVDLRRTTPEEVSGRATALRAASGDLRGPLAERVDQYRSGLFALGREVEAAVTRDGGPPQPR
jgi:hypothetical protein